RRPGHTARTRATHRDCDSCGAAGNRLTRSAFSQHRISAGAQPAHPRPPGRSVVGGVRTPHAGPRGDTTAWFGASTHRGGPTIPPSAVAWALDEEGRGLVRRWTGWSRAGMISMAP